MKPVRAKTKNDLMRLVSMMVGESARDVRDDSGSIGTGCDGDTRPDVPLSLICAGGEREERPVTGSRKIFSPIPIQPKT